MEHLTPVLRKEVVDQTIDNLFLSDKRRLSQILDKIVLKNNALLGDSYPGFLYNGDYYLHTGQKRPRVTKTLHFDLYEDFQNYYRDLTTVRTDQSIAQQIMFTLTHQANDMQELRDSFPDFLVSFSGYAPLARLPRKFTNFTFLIQNNKNALGQVEKYMPKLEMYAAMAFIV